MKIHHEGRGIIASFIILFAAIDILAYCASVPWSIMVFLLVGTITLLLLAINFFRSPKRLNPHVGDIDIIVAPADGKLVSIEEVFEDQVLHKPCLKVSIFMSIYDVHANWCCCNGVVRLAEHTDGNFYKAYLPKSSTENERSAVIIETPAGYRVLERQIAGAVARRIVTYVKEGDEVTVNDFLGFIKFGSRVDLYLPLGTVIDVPCGTHVQGNTTILGRLPKMQ